MTVRRWSIGRLAAVIGVVACFTSSDDAASAPGDFPYCAASRGHEEYSMNCGFATFEACLEELKGMRGYCAPNPYYVGLLRQFLRARRSSRRARVHVTEGPNVVRSSAG